MIGRPIACIFNSNVCFCASLAELWDLKSKSAKNDGYQPVFKKAVSRSKKKERNFAQETR